MKRLTKLEKRLMGMNVRWRCGLISKKGCISIIKNPRKLKKTMKRSLERQHGETMKQLHCRLHWVPGRGWTVTQKLPLANTRSTR